MQTRISIKKGEEKKPYMWGPKLVAREREHKWTWRNSWWTLVSIKERKKRPASGGHEHADGCVWAHAEADDYKEKQKNLPVGGKREHAEGRVWTCWPAGADGRVWTY